MVEMLSLLQSFNLEELNVSESAWGHVTDIFRIVNHDTSPPPDCFFCFQCECFPFVSVDQMSKRLLCWSVSLLIRSDQRPKQKGSPTSSFLLFTQTLGASRHGKSTLSDFIYKLQEYLSRQTFLMWYHILFSFFVSKGRYISIVNKFSCKCLYFHSNIKGLSMNVCGSVIDPYAKLMNVTFYKTPQTVKT